MQIHHFLTRILFNRPSCRPQRQFQALSIMPPVIFLKLVIAITGGLCVLAARAVDQIEHVIIFMQENRPFDHYFGKMKGVRGFNDRTAVPLRSGLNAFYQPVDQNNLDEYMLPFRTEANRTNAMCMPAPEMYYPTDIAMWNSGRMDAWNTARDPGMGMSYFTREDLPYYYALYDNFAVGDQYYQSTFTCTNPNRMIFFSGSNGLSVGEDAVLENPEPRPGYNWTTMGEILEEAGVSWRVYQQTDNFDDNAFAWFAKYQQSRPGEPLFDKGMARQRNAIQAFRDDLASNSLPSVSWIIAPTRKSEHATNHPCAGEDYTARILATLAEFPETYAKSAFILNYDEGGQFYDHAWSPTPPLSASEGVSTVTVEGEVNTNVLTTVPAPIGLGFRVPLLIVSPWTRGNIVVSEAMDHSSVVQFLEVRFNVTCPNISPWRRAMTGNLLSAFDFEHPNYDWPSASLPDTKDYVREGDVECRTLPNPVVPAEQSMPQQEPGTRVSRALPYEFAVSEALKVSAASVEFSVSVANTGAAGAPFVLYDVLNLATVNPRQYAVEAGKDIVDVVTVPTPVAASEAGRALLSAGESTVVPYHYTLMGINGFTRQFRGQLDTAAPATDACAHARAELTYNTAADSVVLTLSNSLATGALTFTVQDNAYGQLPEALTLTVPAGSELTQVISTSVSGNWYDLSVSLASSECFFRRYLGRMETGKDTISDPAMGAGKAGLWGTRVEGTHPKVPEHLRQLKRVAGKRAVVDKDAQFFLQEVDVDGN